MSGWSKWRFIKRSWLFAFFFWSRLVSVVEVNFKVDESSGWVILRLSVKSDRVRSFKGLPVSEERFEEAVVNEVFAVLDLG